MDSEWLVLLATVSLGAGLVAALLVALDLAVTRSQHMWIMYLVWPITALYGGLLALWFYMRAGEPTHGAAPHGGHGPGADAMPHGEHGGDHHASAAVAMHAMHGGAESKARPSWQAIALATTHCGAGCTVGDILAEALLHYVPMTLYGRPIYAAWVVDYVFAFAFGVAFQFFTIKPMRKLSSSAALKAAFQADALSLSSWQVGMYGWMAIATFGIFARELPKDSPVFWFMMQIAMLAGFVTSYPVNWWLIRKGVKEPM